MDMTTDTTMHLAAQAEEIPARAAASLQAALAATISQRSLADLLAERNSLVDEVDALAIQQPEAPQEALDAITDRYSALEDALQDRQAATADDVVAKFAFIAELVREGACPNYPEAESLLAEARAVLMKACDPAVPTPVDHRDVHWALIPAIALRKAPDEDAASSSFAAQLASTVAKARAYSADFVEPSAAAHNVADHAQAAAGAEDKASLEIATDAAWKAWESHCDVYRAMVEAILKLVPATPDQLLRQVNAYSDLMRVHWARYTKADTPLGYLCENDVAVLAELMHAGLQRLAGETSTAQPDPLPPTTPLGAPTDDSDPQASSMTGQAPAAVLLAAE